MALGVVRLPRDALERPENPGGKRKNRNADNESKVEQQIDGAQFGGCSPIRSGTRNGAGKKRGVFSKPETMTENKEDGDAERNQEETFGSAGLSAKQLPDFRTNFFAHKFSASWRYPIPRQARWRRA